MDDNDIYQDVLTNRSLQEQPSTLQPLSLTDLMNTEYEDTTWVVEQLIPSETIVAISGMPSAYKTWLILDLALKVARGEPLFDKFITAQTGVLMVDEETGERWIQQRMLKLQKIYDAPLYLLSKTGFKLTEQSVVQLLLFAKEKNIGLLMFDSLLRIHTSRDENDAVQMAKVFSLFQKFTKEGISVIFTHHNRKPGILRSSNPSQDMRGSSDILAAVDCHLAIDRKDQVVTVTQTKLRQAEEIKPFRLNVITDENELRFEFDGEIEDLQTLKADFQELVKGLLTQNDNPLYKKEIFETLKKNGVNGGYSTFKTAVQELLDKGELFERKGERNKVFCSLKPFADLQTVIIEDI